MAKKQEKPSAQKQEKATAPGEITVRLKPAAAVPVGEPRPVWPMLAWEREIDRLFEDFRRHFMWPRPRGLHRWPEAVGIQPLNLDAFEQGDDVVVKVELPGMSRDEIEVTLTDSALTVKGEKRKEEEVKDEDYHRCERSFGAFSRTIELPVPVKTEAAKARFTNGVLEIRIPKTEEARRKPIKVQVEE